MAGKKERKEARMREVIREGQEVWSSVEGFMAGMFFFIFRTIGFDYYIPFASFVCKILTVLTGLIVLVLLLSKFHYETWIPIKFLASFVFSYAMFRILLAGTVF